jgi:hypothetical protein
LLGVDLPPVIPAAGSGERRAAEKKKEESLSLPGFRTGMTVREPLFPAETRGIIMDV